MNRTCLAILLAMSIVAFTTAPLPRSALAGSILEVVNPAETDTRTLSDLIAYGADGLKNTLLKLNDPSDDLVIGPGGVRTFDAGFEVKSYFISRTMDGSEIDTIVFDVRQLGPKPFGFVADPTGLQALFASLDYDVAVPPPADGTIVSFVDGLSAVLPGWFVGTVADFDVGTVSGPYTGPGVIEGGFVVNAVPEPSAWLVLSAGGLALLGRRWLSRGRHRSPRLVLWCTPAIAPPSSSRRSGYGGESSGSAH